MFDIIHTTLIAGIIVYLFYKYPIITIIGKTHRCVMGISVIIFYVFSMILMKLLNNARIGILGCIIEISYVVILGIYDHKKSKKDLYDLLNRY